MSKDNLSGKLAVILHADIADSTVLVQQDERLAHERIQDAFRRFSETIEKYQGQVRELRGDALLADFERPSDAVTAALAFQAEHTSYIEQLIDDIRPVARIGIAMGEVIIADNTVTGSGVVLAQRVEQLSEPGGVCITAAIHEGLPKRLPFDQADMGERQVKGFDEPVRVYRVKLKPGQALPQPEPTGHSESSQLKRNSIIALVTVALVVVVGSILWLQPWAPEEEPASIERMAFPLPDKPSIAVLAFDNLSADSEQEYFSDGITEDIITSLSRFPDLFVIARNSTFTFKGKPVKVRQVAEELGVRYVLEGSVQKAGNKVRITAQLVDATTGHHLWAENYDRDLEDIFAVRDEVTRSIVIALMGDYGELRQAELERLQRKDTKNFAAYDYVLRAIHIWLHFTKDSNSEAGRLAEKAIRLDPEYARAPMMLAWVHLNEYRWKWSDNPEKSLEKAYEMARKSIELDDADPWSHWALGVVYLYRGEHEDAIAQYEKALVRNPNDADVLAHMGLPLSFAGRSEQAIEQFKLAKRLNPAYPPWYPWIEGWAQVVAEQYEASIALSKEAAVRFPQIAEIHRNLAVAYHYLGRTVEARAEVEESLRIDPEFTLDDVVDALPFADSADLERFLSALRKSRLPEHPPLPLPDKPSIAVLPFVNMSSDAEQEYFSDGITEDIITDLSKISGLFVIARNSTFAYKDQPVKIRQVAEELGVRYVLEGSVRKAGNQVRINAQLIDTTTGGHIWADRYDGTYDDVFALQDKVTSKIVATLAIKLTEGEQYQISQIETDNTEAYDTFLKGWEQYQQQRPDSFTKAIELFEAAVRLDPNYSRAYAALSATYWQIYKRYWHFKIGLPNIHEARYIAEQYLAQAMKNPSPLSYQVSASILAQQGLHDEAISNGERSIAVDPNDADSYSALAGVLNLAGQPREAVSMMEHAFRLNPHYPASYLYEIGLARFGISDFERAADSLEKAIVINPDDRWSSRLLIATLGHLGRKHDATLVIDNAETNWRGFDPLSVRSIAFWYPFKELSDTKRLAEGLRKAGVPD